MRRRKALLLRRTLYGLMILCAAGVLCCALLLAFRAREYAGGDTAYERLRRDMELREPSGEPSGGLRADGGTAEETPEEQAQSIDFSALKAVNADAVAWLTAEGTELDYPVVRGTDNSYYLTHLVTGERNRLGAVFMDYRNQGDFSDQNTILYGHNMKDGSMFSSLEAYKEQTYYDSHQTMTLYTPDAVFTVELFAGLVLDGGYESIRTAFQGEQDVQAYLEALKQASVFQSDTAVDAGDRIITLCTCSYEFQNARYAVFGKLTPAGGDN